VDANFNRKRYGEIISAETWKRSEGCVLGYLTDIERLTGMMALLSRLIMICRSKTGRLVQTYSNDGGVNWNSAYPMELASSQSPAALVSLPMSGDLLCIWNQVSSEEMLNAAAPLLISGSPAGKGAKPDFFLLHRICLRFGYIRLHQRKKIIERMVKST